MRAPAASFSANFSKSFVTSRKLLKASLLLLLVGLIFTLMFVWSRVRVIQLGYELTRLKSEIATLSQQVGDLRFKVSQKKTLERLNTQAATFGLKSPKSEQVMFLEGKE